MVKRRKDVTQAEFDVLEQLWEQDRPTIREIAQALYTQVGPSEYGTVQKLLDRLETKGWVRRYRSGATHRFAAKADREHYVAHELQDTANRLFGGSLSPLLSHLIRGAKLSSNERRELRQWLDQQESGGST